MYVFNIYQSFFNAAEYFVGGVNGFTVFIGTLKECQSMVSFIEAAQLEIAQTYC